MLIGFKRTDRRPPVGRRINLTKIVVGGRGEWASTTQRSATTSVYFRPRIAAEYPYSASGEFPSGTPRRAATNS